MEWWLVHKIYLTLKCVFLFVLIFFKDLFIHTHTHSHTHTHEYTVSVFRHTRRGHRTSLQMVVSHIVVAGS